MEEKIEITKKLPYKTRVRYFLTSELLKSLLIGGGGFLAFKKTKEKSSS